MKYKVGDFVQWDDKLYEELFLYEIVALETTDKFGGTYQMRRVNEIGEQVQGVEGFIAGTVDELYILAERPKKPTTRVFTRPVRRIDI